VMSWSLGLMCDLHKIDVSEHAKLFLKFVFTSTPVFL